MPAVRLGVAADLLRNLRESQPSHAERDKLERGRTLPLDEITEAANERLAVLWVPLDQLDDLDHRPLIAPAVHRDRCIPLGGLKVGITQPDGLVTQFPEPRFHVHPRPPLPNK
jgi:hypothetical protein